MKNFRYQFRFVKAIGSILTIAFLEADRLPSGGNECLYENNKLTKVARRGGVITTINNKSGFIVIDDTDAPIDRNKPEVQDKVIYRIIWNDDHFAIENRDR